jgi:hypothetical protein
VTLDTGNRRWSHLSGFRHGSLPYMLLSSGNRPLSPCHLLAAGTNWTLLLACYYLSKSKLLYDWLTQSAWLGIEHPCGTCDQILLPVGMLLSGIRGLVSVGRPLWREDGSAVCSVISQWSESRRTRNHALRSHLRLPQPGGPGSRIYIPQEQGGPIIPPGTGFSSYQYYPS